MNWIQLAINLQELWDKIKLDASDWTVVVSGISIVMGTLILLIIVFYLFGFVVSHMVDASQKRAAKKAEKKKQKICRQRQRILPLSFRHLHLLLQRRNWMFSRESVRKLWRQSAQRSIRWRALIQKSFQSKEKILLRVATLGRRLP